MIDPIPQIKRYILFLAMQKYKEHMCLKEEKSQRHDLVNKSWDLPSLRIKSTSVSSLQIRDRRDLCYEKTYDTRGI